MSFIGSLIEGLTKTREPETHQRSEVPDPRDAKAKARSEIERRKRIIALSGGKTLLTTETGIGPGAGKTLLGQ